MFKTFLKVCVAGFRQKNSYKDIIFLTADDYSYTLDDIYFRDRIEFERNVSGNSER